METIVEDHNSGSSTPKTKQQQQQPQRQHPPTPARKHQRPWPAWLLKLRLHLWEQIEDLLEEFSPWLKWLVLDALLALLVRFLAARFERLTPFFEAIGWL